MEILDSFLVVKIKTLPLLCLILGNSVLDKNQLFLPALILVCSQNLHINLTAKYLMVQQLSTFCLQLLQKHLLIMPTKFLSRFFFSSWRTQAGLIVSGMLARTHRGSGLWTKVSGQTKLLRKWSDFLKVAANKKELYYFLTEQVGIWYRQAI